MTRRHGTLSRPRWSFESWMAVLAFWRTPRTTRIRGALSLNEHATWSSQIKARIIFHRDHCSGFLPQTVQLAEAQSGSPSSQPTVPLSKSRSSSDRRPRIFLKKKNGLEKTRMWRHMSRVRNIDNRLDCQVSNLVALDDSGVMTVQFHISS